MRPPGKLLHQVRDENGILCVVEDAGKRVLTFGNHIEQSVMDTLHPLHLCHNYTQLMLLGILLIDQPRHCTVLGLGGGSLPRTLFHLLPDCRIDAVEQRPLVADIAYQWFELPRERRLRVHIADAGHYLNSQPTPADILLSDLYLADGMDQQQAQLDFLTSCRAALKPGGLLVANFWLGSGTTAYALNNSLQEVFDQQLLSVTIPDGNCIVFAFDGGIPRINQKQFIHQAEQLGARIDTPLQRHARSLYHQNRQALHLNSSR